MKTTVTISSRGVITLPESCAAPWDSRPTINLIAEATPEGLLLRRGRYVAGRDLFWPHANGSLTRRRPNWPGACQKSSEVSAGRPHGCRDQAIRTRAAMSCGYFWTPVSCSRQRRRMAPCANCCACFETLATSVGSMTTSSLRRIETADERPGSVGPASKALVAIPVAGPVPAAGTRTARAQIDWLPGERPARSGSRDNDSAATLC